MAAESIEGLGRRDSSHSGKISVLYTQLFGALDSVTARVGSRAELDVRKHLAALDIALMYYGGYRAVDISTRPDARVALRFIQLHSLLGAPTHGDMMTFEAMQETVAALSGYQHVQAYALLASVDKQYETGLPLLPQQVVWNKAGRLHQVLHQPLLDLPADISDVMRRPSGRHISHRLIELRDTGNFRR